MNELHELSATELIEKIRKLEISVAEVTSTFLQRIAYVNPCINAIHQVEFETINQEAVKLDKKIKLKLPLGILHGLPVSIKDAFHVKNFICSKGSLGLYHKKSSFDATVVSRLRKEGANILGLTNTSELLLTYESDNLIYGQTKNPFDPQRTAGGSSGGSGAIVSMGGTPVSIGNDAGGSLRLPAHYCGVSAHKPTHGFIPNTGNVPLDGYGLGSKIISIGPIARYVEDLILLMKVLCGADGIDPHAKPLNFNPQAKFDLTQLKIAYFYGSPRGKDPSSETVKAIDSIVDILKPEVKEIKEVYPSMLNQVHRLHYETFILGGDGGRGLRELINNFENQRISPSTQKFLEIAQQCEFSVTSLRERLVEVDKFCIDMNLFMQTFDILLSPVSTTPALHHGETFANIDDFGYITAHNLTGWPATVIPCSYSNEGLPIGVQLVGKPWLDHITLNLALFLQQIIGVFKIPKLLEMT